MKTVAKFEKVSFEQFKEDWINCSNFPKDEEYIKKVYDGIKLPSRATNGSSGYDFKMPIELNFPYGVSVLIPSGIRLVFFEEGYDLICMPRSGLGFKYRLQLDNTVALIDNDYHKAKNTGHIMFKLTCKSNNKSTCSIDANTAFAQGVIREFFLAEGTEDEHKSERIGGFGSTSK